MNPLANNNNNFSPKRLIAAAVLAVCLLGIIFFAAIGRFNAPLFNTITVSALAPFQSVGSFIGSKYTAFTEYVGDVFYVYDENRELKANNDALTAQAAKAAELEAENAQLSQVLNYRSAHPEFTLLPARVISRSSSAWTSHIIIDRGTDDGVQKNMTVVTPDGLVGNVNQAYASYADVELITDPRSAVSAIVQRADSRVPGVVKGAPDSSASITMNNIPQNANIVEGDVIVTSGFGGVYPKGIPIGSVYALKNDSGGLLQYAVLYPNVDFQKLEIVSVITNYKDPLPQSAPAAVQQTQAGELK